MADLFPLSSAPTDGISYSGSTWGNLVTPSANVGLASIYWYRGSSGDVRPSYAQVWRASDGALVASVAVPVDDGTIGWHGVNFPSPVALTAGAGYYIVVAWAGASNPRGWATSPPSPGAGWTITGARYHDGAATSGTASFGTSSWELIAVDASAEPATGGSDGSTGTGGPAYTGDLEAWLSNDTSKNLHQTDGAPWETNQNVKTIKSEAEGVNGFAAIKAVADAIAAAVSGLPGTIAGAVTTITGQLTSMAGSTFVSANNSLVAITNRVLSSYDHALDVLAGNVTFPGASPHWQWVAGTPVAFEGAVALAVPADAYVLDLTALPRGLALNDSAGVHVVYRAGWWCPLNDTIGEERHFVDFEHTRLVASYGRMAGCLVQLGPEGAGTITPYTLEPV